MIGASEMLRRCAVGKQTADLCTSSMTQLIAAEYLASGRYLPTLSAAWSDYKLRMQAMADGISDKLREHIDFVRPKGGMFIWVTVRSDVSPKRLFDCAVESGVLYVPGAAFYAGAPEQHVMRLSYATSGLSQIAEGTSRLERAFGLAVGGPACA